MYKIKALGGSEFVLGFRLAGVAVKEVNNVDDARVDFEELIKDEELGIIITDDKTINTLSEHFRELIEKKVKPVTVVLSTSASSQDTLRKQIQKSIGVDLWKDED